VEAEPDTKYEQVNHEHFRKLERMYALAPINTYFKPTLLVSLGSAEVCIPIHPDFFHAAAAVHGSVYFKAMDDAAFFACNSLRTDFFVLTVTFNVYFLRPVSNGEIRAFGRVIHHSGKLLVADSILTDSDGCEIGRGSGTFMPGKIPLTGEIGYA
jgi:uncharacterized protein (TIGR00369 family)